MGTLTHGKCARCVVIYRWPSKLALKLRDAACPVCGEELERTANAAVLFLPVRDVTPNWRKTA